MGIDMIRKRDGREVPFDQDKIEQAIFASFQASGSARGHETSRKLTEEVVRQLENNENISAIPSVEQVQDTVEQVLMRNGFTRTAKSYILYRAERSRVREMNSRLMRTFGDIVFKDASESDIKRENANINGDTAMGAMLKFGSEGAKQYYEKYVMDPRFGQAHMDGDIHIHDMDFYTLTTTCCQIELKSLFKGGFSTGHGYLREPQDITSYAALACIAIQANQNDQHGGQAIVDFDYGMAPGVKKTFIKRYRMNLSRALELLLNFVFGVFATRVMIRGAAAIKALRNPWLYGAAKPGQDKAEKKPVDFVSLRKKFLTISACLMAAILLCAVVFGVHLDTEFTGGAMITLSYEGSFDQATVQKTAAAALENTGLTLQTGENVATGDQTLKISMPGTETVTTEQVENLLDSLNENYPDNQFTQLSLSNVSAAMGTKFLQKSLVAVLFALVLILLYIALRFKNIGGLTGGMMAVLALVNDLMVVFGTFVLLRTALDGNFIAAMLTILGYSINDTVVVYDRIRENRALMGKKAGFEELVNQSVNQSARRTLITTITTVMALGVMCIVAKLYGLDSIFTFAFPLMMGMISGVYTSLCVSTSAWVLWSERRKKKD